MYRIRNLSVIFKSYLLTLSVFTLFRVMLFITENDRVSIRTDTLANIFYSFLMGLRFDVVISGYILLLPALILSVMAIWNKWNELVYRGVFYWILTLFTISFVICAADIPYFNQFFSRFTIGAFAWIDSPYFVMSMIIEEPKYYLILIPLVILVVVFYKLLHRIFFAKKETSVIRSVWIRIMISVVMIAMMLVGIRGRIERKSPIRIGSAYFCQNPFLNQLGLNPVFTLMRSYLDEQDKRNRKIHFMPDDKAIEIVQDQLNIDRIKFNSPIAREVIPDSISQKPPNVVLVIMEGMSAAKMSRHGNPYHLTPFLDSLANHSYYFENIYTAGKHTFNGIFGALFSFPALYRQHPLKEIKRYNGLGSTLHELGYSTIYFTTHDGQFDNVEGFLRANDFNRIVSKKDYPSKEVKTTLGVPDDFLFEFAITELDALSRKDQPFFAAIMTASDHGPYYIPDYFTPRSSEIKLQIVEYADWSLQKFVRLAAQKEWFNNTIFVFVADHGAPLTAAYDISLDYFHTPLIFYAPGLFKQTAVFDCIGGQIDIFPTLMGLLRLPYINNSPGVDLIQSNRPFIFINDDDKIGILDRQNLLILNSKKCDALYHYRNSDTTNYANKYPELVNEMAIYARANLQVFQSMLNNHQTRVDAKLSK